MRLLRNSSSDCGHAQATYAVDFQIILCQFSDCLNKIMFLLISLILGTNVDIDIDATKVLHQANPLYMGCHSDSGFVHEVG